MNSNFEKILKEIDKINKALDKMNELIPNATEEEKQQIYVFMEYLEQQYKKLQMDLIIEERNKKI